MHVFRFVHNSVSSNYIYPNMRQMQLRCSKAPQRENGRKFIAVITEYITAVSKVISH